MALALWANATKMESPSLTEFGKTTVKSGFEENIGQITGKDANRVKFRLDNGSSTIFYWKQQ